MDRWKNRARKLDAKKRRMKVHGKNLSVVYANAILKRVGKGKATNKQAPQFQKEQGAFYWPFFKTLLLRAL